MEERVAEGRERRRFENQGLNVRIVTRGILAAVERVSIYLVLNFK